MYSLLPNLLTIFLSQKILDSDKYIDKRIIFQIKSQNLSKYSQVIFFAKKYIEYLKNDTILIVAIINCTMSGAVMYQLKEMTLLGTVVGRRHVGDADIVCSPRRVDHNY
ncbi:hypothetical protein BpHYR1_048392 [Brachionus plicatilis]|uniref:Uncharacterized protein n=1 Tax=Brachionus plicatilis TaxID=10195 RepID=A0A3M7SZ76_BRAPC|nr:hypothetical protein BpHYR1_048392 [Brachionus plicatilis]